MSEVINCQSLTHWSVKMDNDGIVWLKINVADKSVNVLTRAVVNELAVILDALEADSKITGLACCQVSRAASSMAPTFMNLKPLLAPPMSQP